MSSDYIVMDLDRYDVLMAEREGLRRENEALRSIVESKRAENDALWEELATLRDASEESNEPGDE